MKNINRPKILFFIFTVILSTISVIRIVNNISTLDRINISHAASQTFNSSGLWTAPTGIYSITVSNEYTNQSTVKKIYVGKDSLLRAHMTSGLAISEINDLISQGAKISESGAIQLDDIKINIPLPGQTEKANQSNSWVKIFFIAARYKGIWKELPSKISFFLGITELFLSL